MRVNPSIFGLAGPKFVLGTNHILFDHAFDMELEPEYQDVMQESALNANRTWVVTTGKHYIFRFKDYLTKYNDPLEKWNQVASYEKQLVTLHWARDKNPFKDSSGLIVPFMFERLDKYHLTGPNRYDVIVLQFRSSRYVDITKSTITTIIDDLDRWVTDDLGGVLM